MIPNIPKIEPEPPPLEPAKKYISVKEFGRMVDLSPFMIYRLVTERKIPYLKMGDYRSRKVRVLINWREAIAALEKEFDHPARSSY